jgi:alanine racemase
MSSRGAAATPTALGRPNVFEIDLGAIAHNLGVIRSHVGPVWLCAAIKADAYGYGLSEVARTALDAGADAVAVGDVSAGVRLRRERFRGAILVYPGTPADPAVGAACAEHGLTATVYDAVSLGACLSGPAGPLEVFLKVDVGLQRLGFAPAEVPAAAARLAGAPGISLSGVYTHLHVPDRPDEAPAAVQAQFERFVQAAAAAGPRLRRMAASSRVLAGFRSMALEGVDPGRAVYGIRWEGDPEFQARLRPAFAGLRSRLLQVKRASAGPYAADTDRLGVIPIGRRDGLGLLTCGEVLVRGRRAPLLGAPALEHCRVDLGHVPAARAGDEVVIIGRQGAEEITVDEVLAGRPDLAPTALALEVRASVARAYRT